MGDVYWYICLVEEATFAFLGLRAALSPAGGCCCTAGGNARLHFTALSLASFSKWPCFATAWLGSWTRAAPPEGW